ncbi:MlaD family protein [Lyngbya confervoides]|uniref:MlaD family protein n=1 Tax=Lyngbya confervoides BDU141951 TaxID=1574623 RepID=A0ABD4T1U8_9CYAN|nr:MlaD family protein [Lyngbya confervoides]MCM1982697.1 MlaD family protein [Lyngbya confervoides BDU141951]
MQSRAIKEGSVGLLLLGGALLLGGGIFWMRGLNFQGQSYQLQAELPDALGLDAGSPVRYRGVKVGQVNRVQPGTNGVLVEFQVRPATLLIPRDSLVETSQSGFVGQVTLNVTPPADSAQIPSTPGLTPFGDSCDSALILCDGDRLIGQSGATFDELIRSTTRIAKLLGDGDLLSTTNTTLKNLSLAALSFRDLSRNANRTLGELSLLSREARRELGRVDQIQASVVQAATSVTRSADQLGNLGNRFIQTADRIDTAATGVSSLIQDNRGTLLTTLDNLNEASQELNLAINGLTPILSKVEQSQIIENLETLTANGAQVSQNLKSVTATANSPLVLVGLAKTLDAARVTFQNTQKITTDLEQVTGNAEFRENLIRLINGLSKLLSSTRDLEKQYNAVQQPVAPTAFVEEAPAPRVTPEKRD